MKKLFSLFVALLATTSLWAHDFEVDGIYYNYLEDNNVAVTYEGSSSSEYSNEYSGEVTIPSTVTYEGTTYSVTSIRWGAFASCSSLTSITIPNSVTSIGDYAFQSCSSLASITIPNSVTSIGGFAFSGTGIYNDESNWENKVLYIDDCLIDARTSISGAYTINDNARLIADYAFYECSSLTSITIPNSVTSIGSFAFWNCSSLTSVTIGNSVTSIGQNAFRACSALTSVTIPNSVTSIKDEAFWGCSSLNSVSISNSVTSIGYSAFSRCSSLTSVTIGNSVKSIGYSAFEYCSSLTSITIPNSVTSIGYWAFRGCSSLTSVTIGNSVTSIGSEAFEDCSSLESIFCYSNTPPSIAYTTFSQYNATLYVPSSKPYENHIAWGNFKIIISMGNEMIFTHDGLYYKTISSESIISLSLLTQENFNKFTPISLVGSQNWHYDSRYGATMNGYQNNVTHQNEDWLISPALDLSKYSSATLEFSHAFGPKASVPSTADQKAQYTCWISNDFNGDVATAIWTELPITYGTSAWSYITTTVDIPAENLRENCHIAWKYVCDDESATWEINDVNVTGAPIQQVEVISRPNKYSGDIVIPTTATNNDVTYDVVAIGSNAFSYCSSLTSITIPNSVTTIGYGAFYCSSLRSITIPNSVTSIGERAFQDCSSLTSVTIGNSVTSIEAYAFRGCSSLTSITIPNSVTSIGGLAFYNCSSLTSIIIPYGVTSIGVGTFWDCSSLSCVTIPNSVTNIGEKAFSGCTALNEITLPTSVKSIGENAFAGCTKLYDIYCFAMEPPTAYESSFANYNAFLHVPCDNQRVYLLDVIFGNFKYIECIEAETTPTDTVVVTPSFYEAEFIWPSNNSADSYTLAISKDGEVFCTLTFNANGQLTGIAFAPSRNGQHNAPAAAQTANGFAFTVTGLDEGVNYTYNLLVQDRSGNTLQSYSGKFTTQSTTAVENTHSQSPMTNCQKLLRNGQLIILRDGVEYNAVGVRL